MTEKILLGIDEVGRGPWAGPLVVGAVILGPAFPHLDDLTDSKKLTAKKREELNSIILDHALATGLGWASASEIDRYGLSPALKLATRRAVKQVLSVLSQAASTPQAEPSADHDVTSTSAPSRFDEIVIDGTINLLSDTPLADMVTLLPKADTLVKAVSAASIIAKVARDRYMVELASQYPHYGFEKHVGYGTAAHKSALLEHGPCPEHRRSFRPIAELLPKAQSKSAPRITTTSTTTTSLGRQAEQTVTDHLETTLHHTIIARNHKTKLYEIDIISVDEDTIYFTEVKYRKTSSHGVPLAAVTPGKQRQIRLAAQAFLADHPEYNHLQPYLTVASVSGPKFHLDNWLPLAE